jgi:HlyD family secretion protein
MSSLSSGAPAPAPDRSPAPGPSIVPPKPPRKGRFAIWGIPLILALFVGGAALYWNSNRGPKTSGGSPVLTVPVFAVSVGQINRTVRVSGTVAAKNFVSLLAPRIQGSRSGMNRGGFGGAVGMVVMGGGGFGGDFNLILLHLAKAGTRVKAGDVVAEFDPQFQLQRLDDYKDSVIQNENSVKKLLANLAATQEAEDQKLRASKASWQQSVLDLQTAPVRSRIQAEQFKLTAEQNEATFKQVTEEDRLTGVSQRALVRVTELNRDQTKIEMQRAESNVQKMTIKSPMDGITVMASIVRNGEYGQVREGDTINAGQPFLTIVDTSSMVLNAGVNQVDAEKLRLGMKATVHLDAYPDLDLPGTLIGIGALSKSSAFRAGYVGEIPILLKIEKADARVIPDLTGSADVVLSSEQDTLVAPREAVFQEDGSPFVFVQGPEGWVRKTVELGLDSFTSVAIRSGLQKGDVIALQRPI